ncbi:MAG TPA: DUF2071 domain-containing protein [Tepidisphaeraceae bacterium]|nr:DUF2071 domain-containing protein [Tepidisphaeraceae bacterium]
MRWHELLFMHWPIRPGLLRPLLPAGLELDTFDGEAWLGLVPFRMSGVRPRGVPPIPGMSAFPELNVRTYVTTLGRPGVWFFSLDAANWPAVRMARRFFHLPYFNAAMAVDAQGDEIRYHSRRTHCNAPSAELRMRYRPTGPAYFTREGNLDHFLTHRLCLYCANSCGQIFRGDIHHVRWSLQPAEAEVELNEMSAQIGVALPDIPPLLHYAHRLDTVAWLINRIEP